MVGLYLAAPVVDRYGSQMRMVCAIAVLIAGCGRLGDQVLRESTAIEFADLANQAGALWTVQPEGRDKERLRHLVARLGDAQQRALLGELAFADAVGVADVCRDALADDVLTQAELGWVERELREAYGVSRLEPVPPPRR